MIFITTSMWLQARCCAWLFFKMFVTSNESLSAIS
jgi:hypothetical protein